MPEPGVEWELPLDPEPPRRSAPARPPWVTVVAAIFVLNGLSLLLYAGYLDVAPPWAPDPLPAVGIVIGLIALVAAGGIYTGRGWARWLGIALNVSWLARDGVLLGAWLRDGNRGLDASSPSIFLDLLLPIAINLILAALLLLRWPARA